MSPIATYVRTRNFGQQKSNELIESSIGKSLANHWFSSNSSRLSNFCTIWYVVLTHLSVY